MISLRKLYIDEKPLMALSARDFRYFHAQIQHNFRLSMIIISQSIFRRSFGIFLSNSFKSISIIYILMCAHVKMHVPEYWLRHYAYVISSRHPGFRTATAPFSRRFAFITCYYYEKAALLDFYWDILKIYISGHHRIALPLAIAECWYAGFCFATAHAWSPKMIYWLFQEHYYNLLLSFRVLFTHASRISFKYLIFQALTMIPMPRP